MNLFSPLDLAQSFLQSLAEVATVQRNSTSLTTTKTRKSWILRHKSLVWYCGDCLNQTCSRTLFMVGSCAGSLLSNKHRRAQWNLSHLPCRPFTLSAHAFWLVCVHRSNRGKLEANRRNIHRHWWNKSGAKERVKSADYEAAEGWTSRSGKNYILTREAPTEATFSS